MKFRTMLALLIGLPGLFAPLPGQERWSVGILVYSGVYNTEFVAPYDVLQHVDGRGPEVEVFLVAPESLTVVSAEGMRFSADYTFAQHPPIDILIIPSFKDYESDLKNRLSIVDWVRRNSESARLVLSNCWGAFYLAQAGLLDGRRAMTYPPDNGKLQDRFPKINVVFGKRFVRDGKFVTGAGGAASYDNALYVVQELWGEKLAKRIASGLVIDWKLEEVDHYIQPEPRR